MLCPAHHAVEHGRASRLERLKQIPIQTRRTLNSETLPNPASQKGFTSKRDMLAYFQDVFTATVDEYVRIRQLSPVIAHQLDPDPTVRSEKITYSLIDYAVDIEHATEAALKGRQELQCVWFDLAQKKPVDMRLAQEVGDRCGRFYAARKLEPWKYYRRNRYPQHRAER